jgi:hypothetical protein
VGVKRGIAGGAGELFTFFVRNVPACVRIFVPFGKAEVDHVNNVLLLANADQEVVRLDVAVQKSLLVDIFDALEHLNRNHQHSLQAELSVTELKQVFERRPKEIHHEHVIFLVRTVVVHTRNSASTLKQPIQFRLIVELREFGLQRLDLRRHFFVLALVCHYKTNTSHSDSASLPYLCK